MVSNTIPLDHQSNSSFFKRNNYDNSSFNIHFELYKTKNYCVGSIIFTCLLLISIIALIIGYLETIVIKIDKNLAEEFTWFNDYIIANKDDQNNLYTTFYSYLVGWCATGTSIIFFIFLMVFKLLLSINIKRINKYYESEDVINSLNNYMKINYFIPLFIDSLALATIKNLIIVEKNHLKNRRGI